MERAQRETILGLLERGWDVTLVARSCALPAHERLRWIRVPTPARPFSLGFPAYAAVAGIRLRRHRRGRVVSLGAIVPNRVDAITVQFCHAGFREHGIARAVRATRTRRVNDAIGSAAARWLERWCFRRGRVGRLLPVSPPLARQLAEHFDPALPATVVPNGVDVDHFRADAAAGAALRERLDIPADALVVGFVGGDWERKGLQVALEAAAQAGWWVLVAGVGDEAAYASRADRLGVPLRFAGRLEDPIPAFSAADAFTLPSVYEGFALVTLEAAACGLPVLVTAATGAGPLVEAGAGELLPRDADAFGQALRRLSERAPRRTLGAAARSAAEGFGWEAIVDAYIAALPGS